MPEQHPLVGVVVYDNTSNSKERTHWKDSSKENHHHYHLIDDGVLKLYLKGRLLENLIGLSLWCLHRFRTYIATRILDFKSFFRLYNFLTA
jgi:hypothetical protein